MVDTDHDKIIRMEEKVDTITKIINELKENFSLFKIEYRENHENFRREIINTINTGLEDAKESSVKYADNAVISAFRDKGGELFAEKRVQTVVYSTIKVILYLVLTAILASAGFMGFQSYGG